MHIVADLYAEVVGVVAQSRYASTYCPVNETLYPTQHQWSLALLIRRGGGIVALA